jgi:ribosomal protein S30
MGMREAPYVMTMISTYGTLERTGKETERNPKIGPKAKFNYPEVFGNHFKYRHMVDDHNGRRHAPNSFEMCWATKTWSHRVFAFLVAVTEVNCLPAVKHFYKRDRTSQFDFRIDLANELIFNKYLITPIAEVEESPSAKSRTRSGMTHQMMTVPQFQKFRKNILIKSNMKHGQYKYSVLQS